MNHNDHTIHHRFYSAYQRLLRCGFFSPRQKAYEYAAKIMEKETQHNKQRSLQARARRLRIKQHRRCCAEAQLYKENGPIPHADRVPHPLLRAIKSTIR